MVKVKSPKKEVFKEQMSFVDVSKLEIESEQLSMEILQTREELAVITEVRDELVNLYADFKDVEKLKNELIKENDLLKSDIEQLSEKLNIYKIAEEKLNAEKKLQKLEQLSAKFTSLGQEKTVEELQTKDEGILLEFERIVDAALIKVGETSEMPSVTINSQGNNREQTSKEEKPSDEVAEKPKEQLNNKNFFANICNSLSNEQLGNNNKKIKTF